MDPTKVPGALHGFLKNCGLSVSRGDAGTLDIEGDGDDNAALSDFLSAPLMSHLSQNKNDILSLVDAEPPADDMDGDEGDSDGAILSLAKGADDPMWLEAFGNVLPKVAERKWTRLASRAVTNGGRIPEKSEYLKYETSRLRALIAK